MERELSDFLGVKKCLLVNSGSSANLVAISALTSYKLKEKRIKKDDEVITVAAGFDNCCTYFTNWSKTRVYRCRYSNWKCRL